MSCRHHSTEGVRGRAAEHAASNGKVVSAADSQRAADTDFPIRRYDVIRFIHYLDPETSQAVYDADTSILFGASDDPQLCVDPTAANANAVPALLVPATPMGEPLLSRAGCAC